MKLYLALCLSPSAKVPAKTAAWLVEQWNQSGWSQRFPGGCGSLICDRRRQYRFPLWHHEGLITRNCHPLSSHWHFLKISIWGFYFSPFISLDANASLIPIVCLDSGRPARHHQSGRILCVPSLITPDFSTSVAWTAKVLLHRLSSLTLWKWHGESLPSRTPCTICQLQSRRVFMLRHEGAVRWGKKKIKKLDPRISSLLMSLTNPSRHQKTLQSDFLILPESTAARHHGLLYQQEHHLQVTPQLPEHWCHWLTFFSIVFVFFFVIFFSFFSPFFFFLILFLSDVSLAALPLQSRASAKFEKVNKALWSSRCFFFSRAIFLLMFAVYFFFFFPGVKSNIAMLQELCWIDRILFRCWRKSTVCLQRWLLELLIQCAGSDATTDVSSWIASCDFACLWEVWIFIFSLYFFLFFHHLQFALLQFSW